MGLTVDKGCQKRFLEGGFQKVPKHALGEYDPLGVHPRILHQSTVTQVFWGLREEARSLNPDALLNPQLA